MRNTILSSILLLAVAASTSAATINVPADQTTIQAAINAASAGDTIQIAAGTYLENIDITKQLSIVGSGNGDDPLSSTILKKPVGSSGAVVTLSASGVSAAQPLLISNLRIVPEGVYGINAGSVDYIKLAAVSIVGPQPRTIENEVGFKVASQATVQHLVISRCAFEYLDYGLYFAKDFPPTTSSTVQDVTIDNTRFANNDYKAVYVEKLEDAAFVSCAVEDNGASAFWNNDWNGGIDINLKGGVYQNITLQGCSLLNNGLGFKEGAALMIKARGTGNDTSYSSYPATLTGVTIRQCRVIGNERGIRFGEPSKNNTGPTGVVVEYNRIYNNLQAYSGTDGSAYGDLVNQTTTQVDAENNWWGRVDLDGSLSKVSGDVDIDPILPTSQVEQILAGARLAATQNSDGGWGWPLAGASAVNTVGPIATGLAKAYRATKDVAMFEALQRSSAFLLAKVNNFSPSDGYLAAELDAALGVTTHVAHLRANFYGPLATDSYNRNGAGTLYSTAEYVALIRQSRASQGIPNLAAWDLGMGLVGALACGVSGVERATWVAGVEAEANELDSAAFYDVVGLAGALYGLKRAGDDGFNPSAGAHAAAESLSDLADILAGYQLSTGGWTWNANYVIEGDYNETLQETAYAVLALNEMGGHAAAVAAGNAYLGTAQLATGGWADYVGGEENNEITAEGGWGASMGDRLSVEPEVASLYIKSSESCVLDLNVANLSQPIVGLQALLNFSSAFFKTGSGDVSVVAGGGTWDTVIWGLGAGDQDLDVSVGINFEVPATQADATTAKITLTPQGNQGVTRVVFRPDGGTDTTTTMLTDAFGSAILPSTVDATITIDDTAPDVSFTATQGGSNVKTGSASATTPATAQGAVTITVTASDALAGLADADPVVVSVAGISTSAVTESPLGTFTCTATVDAATTTGAHAITVTVTDRAGNSQVLMDWLYVNRSVSGTVELESYVGSSRVVTFVATGVTAKTWTVTLTGWSSGRALYTLDDVPAGTTALSAKTAWNLRENVPVTLDGAGQAAGVDFVSDGVSGWSDATDHYLRGGDLNGSNSINIQDYAILKARWYTANSVADIDGDGSVALSDYNLMKANWFRAGDAQ